MRAPTHFAAALLLAACALAPQARAKAQTPAQTPDSVVLPVMQRPGTVIPNIIAVSVGGGPAVNVTFDTGSTGLRIMASDAGPNVRRTTQELTEVYGDGTVFKGYLGYAKLSFPTADGSSVQTASEVPIQIITDVSCTASKPDCPGQSTGRAGVMGLRYNAGGQIFNPLASLPGNLASGFIFDDTGANPSVTVGLTPANTAGFSFLPLYPSQPAIWAGNGTSKGWYMETIAGCFSVAGSPPGCSHILFDTGSSYMELALGDAPQDAVDENGALRAGQSVRGTVKGGFDYQFVTGPSSKVHLTNGTHTNIGEPFFRHFLVAFDEQNGRIGFRPGGN